MKPLIKFFSNEWYFAAPMTLMLLAALTLVLWRWLLNRGSRTNMDVFLPELQAVLKSRGVPGAIGLCRDEPGLIPRFMFVAGLEAAEQGVAAMRRSMASAVELQILPRLNFLIAPILGVAKIATMVGLLGTVISMINTFSLFSDTKAASPTALAEKGEAIGLALFATAFGLMTAIPLVFSHVLFKAWIAGFEVKMKSATQQLLVLIQNMRKPTGDAPEEKRESGTASRKT